MILELATLKLCRGCANFADLTMCMGCAPADKPDSKEHGCELL